MSRIARLSATLGSIGSLIVIIVLAFLLGAVLINGASRPTDNSSPQDPLGAAGAQPAAKSPSLSAGAPAANAASDPFQAKCVTETDTTIRELSAGELKLLDEAAQARGGSGHWLLESDKWASGQLWIGDDVSGAIAAYGGTARDRSGGAWMVTERKGETIGVSLRSIELPSGLTLWAPYNYHIPITCQPDA